MDRAGSGLIVFDAQAVRSGLTRAEAFRAVRAAMIELSAGRVRQLLRSFIGIEPGRTFALMPAAFDGRGVFGAKLVSVFADAAGHRAHQGLVVLFDGESGAPVCVADAAEVTAIRTAAASAVATDALARRNARILAVLGTGLQAEEHLLTIAEVRPLSEARVWGRSFERTRAFAERMTERAGYRIRALATVAEAVSGADIVCTVTSAAEPILFGEQVEPGVHLNIVGSSAPGPCEIDETLVAKSRMFADHAEHVRAHGAEYLRALASGAIGEDHLAGEIGEVLAGAKPGRTSADEITLYKSLGHAVQDIAVTALLYERAR
jgi:ornithine cyclodeaminase/alanine dehydrogenase-like protein (mu-crystallin family)